MKFAVITHVPHIKDQNKYFAYAPYVREMNIWLNYVDAFIIVAPIAIKEKSPIDSAYQINKIDFRVVPEFNVMDVKSTFKTLFALPKISWKVYKAMKDADHIHLRCPGNMGLIGCLIQIVFPNKPKTAKYAGNWDEKARQPLSYKLQKWILANTFLTKNMQVLVYGEWENSSINTKSFFTASYFEIDKIECKPKSLIGVISFLFVGALSNGKQPLYAIKLVEQLYKNGHNVQLTLYGEGNERKMLEVYIGQNKLDSFVFLKGNQNQESVKQAYLINHFVILPSVSEGWPKVVAEGMFWGCLPVASKVSCVPNMLDNGRRGLLLDMILPSDVVQIESLLVDDKSYNEKVEQALNWSRMYTLDRFENEIKKLVQL